MEVGLWWREVCGGGRFVVEGGLWWREVCGRVRLGWREELTFFASLFH